MKTRKAFLTLFVSLSMFTAFANQGTYRVTSDEVQAFRTLKRIAGVSMPEPTYPVTGDQLLSLLGKIDSATLTDQRAKDLYDSLVQRLESPDSDVLFPLDDFISADAQLEIGSQVRMNSTTGGNLEFDQLYTRVSDAVNVSYITANAWSEYAAARFEIGLTPGFSESSINKDFALEIGMIEGAMPLTAWVSVGNGRLNFSLGRDRLSAGDGKTGNMILGDNFTFQNYMKASYISPYFSYDMTIRGFDPEVKDAGSDKSQSKFFSFNQSSIAVADHRFSVSFLDHFTLTMAEGMLVYGVNPMGDVRFLNPLMFMHNYFSFIGGTTNNYMGAEIAITLPHGFEFNAQVNFDQLQLSSEKGDANNPPNTYGALANISWTGFVGKGTTHIWLEGVITSPYMNQRQKQDPVDGYPEPPEYFQTDLYVGNQRSDFSEMAPLGWYYGSDTIALAFGAEYRAQKLEAGFDFMYRRHGYRNSWDEHKRYTGETSWHNQATWVPEGMAVEKIIDLGTTLSYEVISGVKVMTSASLVEIFNYKNVPGDRFHSIQVTIGAKMAVGKASVTEIAKLF